MAEKTAQKPEPADDDIEVSLKHDVEIEGIIHLAGTFVTIPRFTAQWLQDNGHI